MYEILGYSILSIIVCEINEEMMNANPLDSIIKLYNFQNYYFLQDEICLFYLD